MLCSEGTAGVCGSPPQSIQERLSTWRRTRSLGACRGLYNCRLGPHRSAVHTRSTMDDDPVDTKPTIEEACKPGCSQVRSTGRLDGWRRCGDLCLGGLCLPSMTMLGAVAHSIWAVSCSLVVPATNPFSLTSCCYRRRANDGNGCALLLSRSQRWADYEACIKRVAASGDEEAHCTGQYLDFWKCVDACVRWDPPCCPLGISPFSLRSAACVVRGASHDNDAFSTTFRPRLEETLYY